MTSSDTPGTRIPDLGSNKRRLCERIREKHPFLSVRAWRRANNNDCDRQTKVDIPALDFRNITEERSVFMTKIAGSCINCEPVGEIIFFIYSFKNLYMSQ